MITVKDLVTKIREASIAYYTGESITTDKQFDSLIDELRALDPENPILKQVGWGYKPNRDAVKHKYFVGSLGKIRSLNDKKFTSKFNKDSLKIITPKWDGLASELEYQNGELVQALSRGNGMVGQVIIQHCYSFVPRKIKYKGELFVRGEIVIDRDIFKAIQKEQIEKNEKVSANERNFAAGKMNAEDANEIDKKFNFIAYSILGSTKKKLEQLEFLTNEGFQVTNLWLDSKEEDFQGHYDSIKDFLIDGLVITNNETLEEIAYKFEDEEANAIVDFIDWNMGASGRYVPTLEFKEPLKLEGTEVRRALAFHATFIKENNIGQGTVVSICKANKIIPHIESIVEPTIAILPTECPRCGTKLEWVGLDLCCLNEYCVAKEEARLMNLAEIVGLPKGLAATTLNEWFGGTYDSVFEEVLDGLMFYDPNCASHYEQLLNDFMNNLSLKIKEGFTFSEFWMIMNIPGLGKEMADRLKDVDPRELDKLILENNVSFPANIHENVCNAICDTKYWRQVIPMFKFKESKTIETQFQVVITGALVYHKRKDFEKLLTDKGIKMGTSVSKNTKYLITNDPGSGSNKNIAAQKLGVELITEEDFMKRYLEA